MLILDRFRIRDIISFDLRIGQVYPQDFNYVKVIAVIPAMVADRFGVDVYSLHAQVSRLLPEGSIAENADNYDYLVVELMDGTTRVVGLPWILPDSIRVHVSQKVAFVVTDIEDNHISQIRDVIARYGYHCVVERISG